MRREGKGGVGVLLLGCAYYYFVGEHNLDGRYSKVLQGQTNNHPRTPNQPKTKIIAPVWPPELTTRVVGPKPQPRPTPRQVQLRGALNCLLGMPEHQLPDREGHLVTIGEDPATADGQI